MIWGTERVNNFIENNINSKELFSSTENVNSIIRMVEGWNWYFFPVLCLRKKKTDIEEVDIRVFVFYFIEWKDNQSDNLAHIWETK